MRDATITLRNYRCFSESGASITVGRGITALVGPNNSGKSSFLRALFELRSMLIRPFQDGRWLELARKPEQRWHAGSLDHVSDAHEVFSDSNDRPLCFEISAPRELATEITVGRYTYRRDLTLSLELGDPPFDMESASHMGAYDFIVRGARFSADPLVATTRALSDTLYVGPFRNVIAGQAQHFDIAIGEAFVATWNDWKTGANRSLNKTIQNVTETLRQIFGFKSLEINASSDRKTLQVAIDTRPYRLEELGSGLAEFIVVFANAAIRRPEIILIDEPELHLHPSLQSDFVLSLASYAKSGLVFATDGGRTLRTHEAVTERRGIIR
jgi:energy-coupling factor transporter ATP-binding protein EcfA2